MEVHNCVHCGTETQPTWRFCRRCGTALENLDQLPPIANCSNCSEPVAEGWRFCANCGTGTDTATPASGLSDDAVADLIAGPAPATQVAEPAEPEVAAAEPVEPVEVTPPVEEPDASDTDAPAAESPAPEAAQTQPEPEPTAADEVTEAAPAPAGPDETVEAAAEPVIATPEVSYEPAARVEDASDAAPPPAAAAEPAPPPPPPDPMLDQHDIAAARAEAEAPPAPPFPTEQPAAEVIEPETDPFGGAADADAVPIGEEIVAEAVEDSREPTITIPHRDEAPQIRSSIPRPLGDDRPAAPEILRPIELDRDEPDRPAARDEPAPAVAVPDQAAAAEDDSDRDLPPIDARFRNPGLLGQAVQLMLTISAAFAVAMMVALVVLNNRLDNYATTGEGLNRLLSGESMVNTWMRPLLIAAILITYVFLVMWARRALKNLEVFNNGMEETPPWMWLMPIVNMWVLFRHLDLSWKGSDYLARGARTWKRSPPDVWTVLFVLLPTIGFVLVLYAWVSGADTFERAIDSNAFSIIGYFAIAIGLLAGVRSIGNIIDRQRTRAEGLR